METIPAAAPADRANRFAFATWLFLRLLALVHLVAFVSFWSQLEGLIGPNGLLPAGDYLHAAHEQLGARAYLEVPTLCWIFGAGKFLHVLSAAGVAASLLLFAGVAPAACLLFLWAAYLSLNCAGQIFFNFQWDALLLEATLLAIFLAPWSLLPRWQPHDPPRVARWLLWWLLFRLMFLSGVVKLASGDPTWRDFTALTFHYETQPLPTPLAWYAHQLPAWWHRAECAGLFVLELVAPFFLFAPRALRHNAALLMAGLMAAIELTGNYTFFNLLAIALCLFCLDDAWWSAVLPARVVASRLAGAARPVRAAPRRLLMPLGAFVALFTLIQAFGAVRPVPRAFYAVAEWIGGIRSLNNYGLFAVMTHPRAELIFEGSNDARTWRPYELPHKPGALNRRPTWVAPHQPRLDWELWFAALGAPEQNRWVLRVCEHLLRGTPAVLALFAEHPFPGAPPRYVRVLRYEYHFSDRATRARTGEWWRRTPMDVYVPPASLK